MKKQTEKDIELNKKICNQLVGKRKFIFQWSEDTQRSAMIEASSEKEAREMWEQGEYDGDIDDCDYIDESLYISEETE